MPKFEVLASQVIYLTTIVEADTKEQAWVTAINEGSWTDYHAERIVHSESIEIEENQNA
jgi:hypothetical protein